MEQKHTNAPEYETCPNCGKVVKYVDAFFGDIYGFCTPGCRDEFLKSDKATV